MEVPVTLTTVPGTTKKRGFSRASARERRHDMAHWVTTSFWPVAPTSTSRYAIQFAVLPKAQFLQQWRIFGVWPMAMPLVFPSPQRILHTLHGTRMGVRGRGATQLRDEKSLAGDVRDRWGRVEPASCAAAILISRASSDLGDSPRPTLPPCVYCFRKRSAHCISQASLTLYDFLECLPNTTCGSLLFHLYCRLSPEKRGLESFGVTVGLDSRDCRRPKGLLDLTTTEREVRLLYLSQYRGQWSHGVSRSGKTRPQSPDLASTSCPPRIHF